ncbi:hypothetical protein GTP38_23210 [Duganella sp. FT94W]|uniref:Uncharacterized protein n=1 Tax=Duganella lactea TaxID=2692173 RepID=A0ABW9VF39_9BURK|nr:hypothetical protein [Duganella lactea]MYM37239.1 hypothetical protein [Duganella lactea]
MNIHDQLVRELTYAETIILKMLKHMTVAQKSAAGIEIEEAGASGEGMTRHHERRAVLMLVSAVQMYSKGTTHIDFSTEGTNAPEKETAPLFCKECKHHQPPHHKDWDRCNAVEVREIDLVSGYVKPRCHDVRKDKHGACGPEGKRYQPATNAAAGLPHILSL